MQETDGHEGADDEDVREGTAGVFASANGRVVCGDDDGDHELEWDAGGQGAGGEAKVEATGGAGGSDLLDVETDVGGAD